MFNNTNSKISSFGGITIVHDKLYKAGVAQFIDRELGKRANNAEYKYSDIIMSNIYTTFCGGSVAEDVDFIRKNTLAHLKGLSVPSPDVILGINKKLSVECTMLETDSGKENKINVNENMNCFLLRSAIEFKQIDPKNKELVYDFDHQFIAAEKYDATYSYKNKRGYFPGVATIGNIPFAIEGRNGNCHVKTEQLSTHKRNMKALAKEGVKPKTARMDSGSYIKEVTDYFHEEDMEFFIRANNSATLLIQASQSDDWKKRSIGSTDYEMTSLEYQFGKYNHRIIAYRKPNKSGQINSFTGDSKKYLFIITNDWQVTERQAVVFYNKRGASEQVFDIQNNDFNWNAMPHSDLEYNTVFLIIMAFAHILYRFVLGILAPVIPGLTSRSRIKRFIFKLIASPVKIVKTGRRTYYRLATDNKELIKLANST